MEEIERKFLVASDGYKDESFEKINIVQGFLNSHKKRTVRVRLEDKKGTITIKGKSSKDGTSRFEWEKEINKEAAEQLLKLCEKNIISKTRYKVNVGRHIYEVDEFHNLNEGLIIAEIELASKNEDYLKPNWLGKEVTGDIKYYNSQLSKHPFLLW